MRIGSWILALAASLAIGLGVAGSGNALSLADLDGTGASFTAGNGAVFSEFSVKIKGKGLSRDLSLYEVVPTADGFELLGDFNDGRKGGKIILRYDVAGPHLVGALLALGLDSDAKGRLKVKEKLFDEQRIGKLRVSSRNGKLADGADFELLTSLGVKEKIRIRGDHFLNGSGASIGHSFIASTPEPSAALLLGAGLVALVAGRRRTK
jgi:hypothetical protein